MLPSVFRAAGPAGKTSTTMETSTIHLTVQGRRFAYEAAGQGDPTIFIHGTGFSGAMWMPFARALESRVRSLMVDLLGYGRSEPVKKGEVVTDAPDLAMLAEVATRESQGQGVHVVGHSYGALLAARFALQHRALVRSLALVEPVMFGPLLVERPADCTKELDALFADGLVADPAAAMGEPWVTRLYDYWTGRGAFALLTARQRELQLESSQKAFSEVLVGADRNDTFARYAALPRPLLLVGGERSTASAARILTRLGEVSRAVVHVVPGASHFVPITHGPELLDFLLRIWAIPPGEVAKEHVGAT